MLTYDEAIAYLYSFIDYEKTSKYTYNDTTLNLDRMYELLDRIGNPHRGLRCVHIAGTNGKGSTAAMIASILRSAGYGVGLYTSPHLLTFRERIRIGGKAISERDVCAFVEQLQRVIGDNGQEHQKDGFTFFEVWTALGFLYFAMEQVDFAVVEVGLGGRLDATNVVHALVSVITSIGMDHMHKLGDTPGKIAYEKAGIIKEGGTVITAPQTAEVMEVIRSVCRERCARCLEVGSGVRFERGSFSEHGQQLHITAFDSVHDDLFIPLLGNHQILNTAVAVGAVELLKQQDVALSPESIREGLRSVQWPGRLQVVGHHPLIVLDGNCNVHGAEQIRQSIQEAFPFERLILVMGMCKDKDIGGVYHTFDPLTHIAVVTQADNPRAAPPTSIAEQIGSSRAEVLLVDNVADAIDRARALANPEDLILITGSLYVIGEAMSCFNLDAENI